MQNKISSLAGSENCSGSPWLHNITTIKPLIITGTQPRQVCLFFIFLLKCTICHHPLQLFFLNELRTSPKTWSSNLYWVSQYVHLYNLLFVHYDHVTAQIFQSSFQLQSSASSATTVMILILSQAITVLLLSYSAGLYIDDSTSLDFCRWHLVQAHF